jgi:hypothetical protein
VGSVAKLYAFSSIVLELEGVLSGTWVLGVAAQPVKAAADRVRAMKVVRVFMVCL